MSLEVEKLQIIEKKQHQDRTEQSRTCFRAQKNQKKSKSQSVITYIKLDIQWLISEFVTSISFKH